MEPGDDAYNQSWVVEACWIKEGSVGDAAECAAALQLAATSRNWPETLTLEDVLHAIEFGYVELLNGWLMENDWFDAKELVGLA